MTRLRLLASAFLAAAGCSALAANYHTRADGNWTAGTVWRTGGTICSSGTNTATPPDANDVVYICNTHRVVLNTSPTIQAIEIRNGGELDNDGNNRTLTIGGATPAGSGTTLFTLDNGGVFDPGTRITVVMNPNQAATLTGGTAAGITFYNLTLSPAVTAARIYNFGAAPVAVNGAFNITPSGNNLLTVNMGAAISTAATSVTTIQRSGGSATVNFTTTASNHAFTSGRITIGNGGTLTANDSTITLTSTTGPLFTVSGSGAFSAVGSNVLMNPNANVTLTSGTVAFNDLTLTPTLTTGRTYTLGTGASVGRDLTINPDKVTGGTAILDLDLSAALTVGRVTTITGTNNGRGRLDPTGTDYPLTSGYLDVAVNGTYLPRDSTVTLNGDGIPANCPGGVCPALFTLAGTFTQAGSTVQMQSDGAVTLTSGAITFNNLTINPTITASRTQTFGPDAITVTGNFTVDPAKVAAPIGTLTVSMGAAIGVTGITTIESQGANAIGLLDATASNRALTSGRLIINSGGSLNARDSTITLNNGTPLYTLNTGGVFTPGGSTMVMSRDAATTLTAGTAAAITLNTLELTPTIGGSRVYTFGAAPITLNGDFLINPTDNGGAANTLTVNMGAAITVAGHTTIQGGGSSNGIGLLSTTATDYAFTTGRLSVLTNGRFDANDSTVTLNGASGPLFTRVGTFTHGTSNVVLAPTASVPFNSGTFTGTGTTNAFARLTTNMAGITVTLGDDIRVNTTLDFDFDDNGSGDGIISTGANKVFLPVAGAISGAAAGGHVVGNFERQFTNTLATRTFTFPVGDGVNYAPLTVVFSNLNTVGNLTVNTNAAPASDHPSTVAGTSPAEPNKSVNRYWTLKGSTLAATGGNTATITFNYTSGAPVDNDNGATVSTYVVGLGATCSGSGTSRQCITWTRPTISGTPTATQAIATGMNIANAPAAEMDFVIGEPRRVWREKEFIYTRETY